MDCFADDTINCIWVKLKNGGSYCMELTDEQTISFDGTTVNIGTKTMQLTDVVSYRFGNMSETSIISINGDSRIVFTNEGKLIVGAGKKGGKVILCNTQGVVFPVKTTTQSDGSMVINVSSLVHDMYLLTIGDETFKFIVR